MKTWSAATLFQKRLITAKYSCQKRQSRNSENGIFHKEKIQLALSLGSLPQKTRVKKNRPCCCCCCSFTSIK